MSNRRLLLLAAGLVLTGVLAIGTAYAVGPSNSSASTNSAWGPGGMMRDGYGPGMMGGNWPAGGPGMMGGGWAVPTAPGPGQTGFVAGTQSAPRVVQIYAYPNDRFVPDTVVVQAGETITFRVTTLGPVSHEFMVGPAADVAADKDGTPEIADIGMMQTKSLTYTFSESGPFAFACHEPGHYEAGMHGTIVVQ